MPEAMPIAGGDADAGAGAPAPPSAPRRVSSRTAASTCSATGPSSTSMERSCSMGRVSPTTVGLPSSPQGPSPSWRGPTRVRREAGTVARPSGSTLQGSQSRSATESTAGSEISTSCMPSSCSSSRRRKEPSSSSRRTPLGEGEVEQRRHLGPHLTRLAVDGVAAEQDEVEGSGDAQRGRQGPRRGERVRSRERGIGHVQARGGTPGHPLAQDVLRTGGPERHDRAGSPRGLRQRDPLGHGAAAVRVHLEVDAVADQSPLLEAERLGERDLFGERRDPQRLSLGSCHRDAALTSPRQRRAPAPRPGPWPGCGRSARRGSTTPPRPPGS